MKKITQITILILLFAASVCFTGCNINGNGDIIEIETELQPFYKIVSDGSYNVIIHQSDDYSAVVIAPSNIQPYIMLNVNDQKLTIRKKPNVNFNTNKTVEVHVYCQQLELIYNNGSGNISAEEVIVENNLDIATHGSGNLNIKNVTECENLEVKISGSGRINIGQMPYCNSGDIIISGSGNCIIDYISNRDLFVKISGSGNVNLAGENHRANIVISGSGDYNASELLSNIYDIKVNGSGDSHISVASKLTAIINGSGNVYYLGYPDIVSSGGGSGKLISKN